MPHSDKTTEMIERDNKNYKMGNRLNNLTSKIAGGGVFLSLLILAGGILCNDIKNYNNRSQEIREESDSTRYEKLIAGEKFNKYFTIKQMQKR